MHQLQPKHSKLKPEEVKKVLKKYNISSTQLPTMKVTDKALSVDVMAGDIIKIDRKDEKGEKIPYYRLVVV
ncbi:DNA-directed RNA polymerase subunit RpoH/Rpb5 C-terminal domain-containing protein [Nanoarchaeota archaeon]